MSPWPWNGKFDKNLKVTVFGLYCRTNSQMWLKAPEECVSRIFFLFSKKNNNTVMWYLQKYNLMVHADVYITLFFHKSTFWFVHVATSIKRNNKNMLFDGIFHLQLCKYYIITPPLHSPDTSPASIPPSHLILPLPVRLRPHERKSSQRSK